MSWTNKLLVLFFVVVQVLFLDSYGWTLSLLGISKSHWVFFLLYQTLIFVSFSLIYFRILLPLSITLALLLGINLIIDLGSTGYKVLPPNMLEKVEVVGDVMPGFIGINTITTDAKGFRTTKKINYDDASTSRIFAIGGSTTEELYLDDSETWSAGLEFRLNQSKGLQFEVVNTGVAGLRAIHNVATQRVIEELHPDYLIFLVGVNDWNKHISDSFSRRILAAEIKKTPLYLAASMVQAISKNRSSSKDPEAITIDSGEYYSKQNNSLNREIKKSFEVNDVSEDFRVSMMQIATQCNEGFYKCMFITQPSAYSEEIADGLKKRLWMTPPNERYTLSLKNLINIADVYNDWLIAFGNEVNIPVCDLASKIKPTEEYFYDDVHYNENGAKAVSGFIFECFEEQLLEADNKLTG